jgi:hypothetical protein
VRLFKRHLPYHESDHVLNIAYEKGGVKVIHYGRFRFDPPGMDKQEGGSYGLRPSLPPSWRDCD